MMGLGLTFDTAAMERLEELVIKPSENGTPALVSTPSTPGDGSSTPLATLDELHYLLSDNSVSPGVMLNRRIAALSSTSLTLLPAILPLIHEYPITVQNLMNLIIEYASPRELFMAIIEAIQDIRDRSERFVVSDNEDEETGEIPMDEGVPMEQLLEEFEFLVKAWTTLMPRVKVRYCMPNLLCIGENLEWTLAKIAHEATPARASSLLIEICKFLEVVHSWCETKEDGKARDPIEICRELIMNATSHLGRRLNGHFLHVALTYFYPKYKTTSPLTAEIVATFDQAKKTLKRVQMALIKLLIPRKALFQYLSLPYDRSPFDLPEPLAHAAVAAMMIIAAGDYPVHPLGSSKALEDGVGGMDVRSQGVMIPLLISTLGSIDPGLREYAQTFVFRLAWHSKSGDWNFFLLQAMIEVTAPICATSPEYITRLALFKLLENLVRLGGNGPAKIVLLSQLLLNNPFEHLKVQSLSILRNLIIEESESTKFANHLSPSPSLGISTIFYPHLIEKLQLLSLPPKLFELDLPTSEFPDHPQCLYLTEQLGILRLLLEKDTGGWSGIKSEKRIREIEKLLEVVGEKIMCFKGEFVSQGRFQEEGRASASGSGTTSLPASTSATTESISNANGRAQVATGSLATEAAGYTRSVADKSTIPPSGSGDIHPEIPFQLDRLQDQYDRLTEKLRDITPIQTPVITPTGLNHMNHNHNGQELVEDTPAPPEVVPLENLPIFLDVLGLGTPWDEQPLGDDEE